MPDIMKTPNGEYELAILVVLYKSSLESCSTLKSILDCSEIFAEKRIHLVAWNNGPTSDPDYQAQIRKLSSIPGIDAVYAETLENAPLSKIYNYFLSSTDSRTYLLLDHDSMVDPGYLRHLLRSNHADLTVPHILSNGQVRGPVLNKRVFITDKQFQLDPYDSFLAIGSGLAISTLALAKYRLHYSQAFDEHFALYGVDTSFWLRAAALSRKENITISCVSSLGHSLSRLESESEEVVRFRRKERGLDNGIMLRHYTSIACLARIAKVILKRPFLRKPLPSEFPSIRWILRGFLAGKHPRCNPDPIDVRFHE